MKHRYTLAFALALSLVLVPHHALAKNTQKYVARYSSIFPAALPAATNEAAIQFIISGAGINGGLQPDDVDIDVLKSSRLRSTLMPGQTLIKTRLQNGDLLVKIAGDIRTVNAGQNADFQITINKPNVKSLSIGNPQWADRVANNVYNILGAATIPGAKFVLDPLYVAMNDMPLDMLGIRNLQLYDNITEPVFDGLDVATILGDTYNPALPHFALSPGTTTDDLGLALLIGPEPDAFNYLAATGQIVNPSNGQIVGAFVQGVQAAPEPAGITFATIGMALLGLALRRRRA